MCQRLRQERGIRDEALLRAMEKLPRHWFCTETLLDDLLYDIDRAIKIDCDQTISAPATVALQTQLLEVKPGMKVLEVGTGSGYQTAILCEMGARVFSVERQKVLFEKTRKLLASLHYTAKCFLGDGYQGITEVDYGPYDRAIITCGAPYIPEGVMNQLKVGGILVIPVGDDQGQKMYRIYKEGDDPAQWRQECHGDASFVPMLPGRNFA
jgi:protein-L-isoaspartate(D-aspartate) O-methyltransferase